ncbi:MaoC family dehydratase N-terminal domain-containing protein [Sphingomonas cavernae]|uniref:MaoC family dehydratase n=1 Tax=Sphingomonas cavernae TaxID=2320861 RepID=A0A418WQV5_9SPHN|nr:MaoC family dehydratase N-terminal domain-containing protein [Sphingomonas cavernae]RJF93623.1 MaoC family dehydratase [Sphingomonas cavernae]
MIDRSHIGKALPQSVLRVEAGRLQFFAKAIGETNPIYLDEAAAQAAGYSSLPAPPTFIFAAAQDAGTMARGLVDMGVDTRRVLHAEQGFTYHGMVLAGDMITVTTRVFDIYDKRDGALEFIVLDSAAANQKGAMVAEMRAVVVVRH